MESYKYKGRVVWLYEYKWIDDCAYNRGYKELDGSFVGTAEAFADFRQSEEYGNGFQCWNITRKHANKDQYEDMLYMIG